MAIEKIITYSTNVSNPKSKKITEINKVNAFRASFLPSPNRRRMVKNSNNRWELIIRKWKPCNIYGQKRCWKVSMVWEYAWSKSKMHWTSELPHFAHATIPHYFYFCSFFKKSPMQYGITIKKEICKLLEPEAELYIMHFYELDNNVSDWIKQQTLPLIEVAEIWYGNCRSFSSSASNLITDIKPYSSPIYLHVIE